MKKHYFKSKFEVQRHLQDQHSGIGHQCTGCGLLFNRKNLKHICEVENPTFVYIHRESGIQGEQAREMLMTFIKERQETHWKWVKAEDDEPESPIPSGIRSVVVIPNNPARQPRPRKDKRLPSPVPLEEPDDILLEEPPRKVRKKTTESLQSILQELE